ncbi:NAD(P)/FAD-dependent oxidoreductase [Pseudarthrobacter sp. J75]|uniref:NAD(P)/FAD-dependent oxidoreductase n=1 Tax=unclassified Pseudarthrobacter TaxID=2647000 RepID=UPI002E81CCC0|nr:MULTISPECIES: NAD(P)/FAD-dependent oxidoreductase [unclassified Pseudarthrobacter]MEE2523472.1 NAD(P)/FAD-dependent oxidoreductase [Pseudarthrobacter sp. J47]MEE2530447.1 NAD(P)/FAD-dependent oxidoreductase [Pseudarthrobacter sp. J75]MEE2570159.1 NAD(P)/FAD-dependent oxidoreductase [Pseudarthrobacter sp. J64]
MSKNTENLYDAVIIGGGAAGLSAAQTLSRARRSVAVIDSGEPRNAPAEGVHAFITRDGINPLELLRIARAEAEGYGAVIVPGRVAEASGSEGAFTITLDDGTRVSGRRLLVATGLRDDLPAIPGVQELWGRDVLHCPFCHGWEVRDQAIGIIGAGPVSIHQALLFRQWSSNITLFLNDLATPSEEELEQLAARGIRIVEGAIEELRIQDGRLRGVALASGEVAADALVVGPKVHARLDRLSGLGLAAAPHPSGMGDYLEADESGATAVPGIWAAGSVTDIKAQVLPAAAGGTWAAVNLNNSLMAEELAADVAAYRESAATRV